MAYSNHVIIAEVGGDKFPDVNDALGVDASNRITDQELLCKHANIQKWAKFKPVKFNRTDTSGQFDKENNKWKSGSFWWQANNGMCGMTIPLYQNLNALLDDYVGTHPLGYEHLYPWGYEPPSGGSSAPYRLNDFAGYRNNPRPAINNFMTDQRAYFKSGGQHVTVDTQIVASVGYNVTSYDNGASLSLEDFGKNLNGIAGCYFGVVIVATPADNVITYVGLITTSKKIMETGFVPSVNIPLTNIPGTVGGKSYVAVPFFTATKVDTFTLMPQVPILDNIYSTDQPMYSFSVILSGEWIKIEIINASDYGQDWVSITVRYTTWRGLDYGNSSDGNSVVLYSVNIIGKFASDKGWDDKQVGEPEIDIPDGVTPTEQNTIVIPCRADANANGSSITRTYQLDNRWDGTGAQQHPLRGVMIHARCYHKGGTAPGASAGSWNNLAMPYDDAGCNIRLQAPIS